MADEPVITHRSSLDSGATICGRPIGALYPFEDVVYDLADVNCGKCLQHLPAAASKSEGR